MRPFQDPSHCEGNGLIPDDTAPVPHQLLRHALSNDNFCHHCYAGVGPTTVQSLQKSCRSIFAAQSMPLIAALRAHWVPLLRLL